MKINAKPIFALVSGAILLSSALCQTAHAGLLNESGTSVLADVYGVNTGPEAITVYWTVTESANQIYTYTYVISNAVGDVVLDNNGNPTSKPEIVDAFEVGFDTTQPGAYIMNSQTGGSFAVVIGRVCAGINFQRKAGLGGMRKGRENENERSMRSNQGKAPPGKFSD